MTLADFQHVVESNPQAFEGVRPHTVADFDHFERSLGRKLPESLRWLLGTRGYSTGCGVSNLGEAVDQTLACRGTISLPEQWLLLDDRGDAGAVLLDLVTGKVCWCDPHEIEQVTSGQVIASVNWFAGYPEWAMRCAEDAD